MTLASQRGPVICVCGPTASGKSSLADKLAQRLSSSVISVDAMQVYRGMDIGTAKLTPEQRRAPLLMVDVVDPDQEFSVADFQRLARREIDCLLDKSQVPVLCGGTGLYLDAVIDDMDFPRGGRLTDSRQNYERMAQSDGSHALYELLQQRDPESAELIHINNTRRIIRALELCDEGKSYAQRTKEGLKAHSPYYSYYMWAVVLPKEQLYERINTRVDEMFDEGLVQEVEQLERRYAFSSTPTASQAIGYKELVRYMEGNYSLQEAKEAIKQASRRYAKRQLSWIRRDGRARTLDLSRMSESEALESILTAISSDDGHKETDGSN
ncbi:MAG: tRNA (adenosine(37)-N6)-dimethylallyltransferase MiaA [Atopobiaceae bacterium]|nr:tRNA (adenosine(37)-N6)-dimethylallyltransferase MiaA [Atopobiaceae bacterium]